MFSVNYHLDLHPFTQNFDPLTTPSTRIRIIPSLSEEPIKRGSNLDFMEDLRAN